MTASRVITVETIVWAVERMSHSAASRVFHAAWPSEFPLTLCGEIATEPRARTLAREPGWRGSDCVECTHRLRGLPATSRENPHRG